MSFHEKLQVHVSAKGGDWFGEGHPFAAAWDDAGSCVLVAVPHVLRAADVVDAHVSARARGASVTVAFGGSVTAVARQTAERLGVALLDVSSLPDVVATAGDIVSEEAPISSTYDINHDAARVETEVVAASPLLDPVVEAPRVDAPLVDADFVAPPVPAEVVAEPVVVESEVVASREAEVAPPAELPVAAVAGAWLASRVETADAAEPRVPWAGLPRAVAGPVAVSVTMEEWAAMPWSKGARTEPMPAPDVPPAVVAPAIAAPAVSRANERVDSLRAFLVRGGAQSVAAVPSKSASSHTSSWLDQLRVEHG